MTPWEIFKLIFFYKPIAYQAQLGLKEETEYGVRGKAIFDKVSVGDNLVVPCENDNAKVFWLQLCDKPKHVVKDIFIDAYKNTYYEGDEVIRSHSYDLL